MSGSGHGWFRRQKREPLAARVPKFGVHQVGGARVIERVLAFEQAVVYGVSGCAILWGVRLFVGVTVGNGL